MLCPYKGAALSTLERIKGTVTSYYVNQIYKMNSIICIGL